MVEFDQLYKLGWRLCARRFRLHKYWEGDLLFTKDNMLIIVETRSKKNTGMDARTAAHITADIFGSATSKSHYTLYYGYLCRTTGRVRGIHQWSADNTVPTIIV